MGAKLFHLKSQSADFWMNWTISHENDTTKLTELATFVNYARIHQIVITIYEAFPLDNNLHNDFSSFRSDRVFDSGCIWTPQWFWLHFIIHVILSIKARALHFTHVPLDKNHSSVWTILVVVFVFVVVVVANSFKIKSICYLLSNCYLIIPFVSCQSN